MGKRAGRLQAVRRGDLRAVGAGGYTEFVHGLSRMTIEPRIPTMPGWITSDFRQPGRHC